MELYVEHNVNACVLWYRARKYTNKHRTNFLKM